MRLIPHAPNGQPRRRLAVVVVLCAMCSAPALRAEAQDLTIFRYEPLAGLELTELGAASNGDVRTTMRFTAFGTHFSLALGSNERLIENLPPEQQRRLDAAAEFYVGTLDGNPQSWARIARTAAGLSGAIFDGTELYAIEAFERVSPYAATGPQLPAGQPVIYRWSDTVSALTDVVVSPKPAGSGAQKPVTGPGVLDELASAEKLSPVQQLDIGLIADSEFLELSGVDAETHMLTVANVVDGIFFDQVGVRINVAELRTYAEPDAFSGTSAPSLLEQLGQFKLGTADLRDRGIVHLFTGRDLDEAPETPTGARLLGIANLGAMCDAQLGVSLTQFTTLSTAVIVMAHELGHNFGAPHDAQAGSPCESTPSGYLMYPFANASQQFSQCSLQQMEAELAAAACLTNLTPIDVAVQRLSGPTEVVAEEALHIEFAVDYAGEADALDPRLTIDSDLALASITTTSRASCDLSNHPPVTCRFSTLSAAGGRLHFGASYWAPSEPGPAYVDIEVSAVNDYTPENNRYRFEFNVVPGVRFELSELNNPVAVRPNEVFDLDWALVNTGRIPATNVVAEFRITDTLEPIEVRSSAGAPCAQDPVTFYWLCSLGTVAPGASVPLGLRLRADDFPNMPPGGRGSGTIWLSATAAEPIIDRDAVWPIGITITPLIADVYVEAVAPASVTTDSTVTIAMRVGNRGPDDVSNVSATLRTWTLRGLTFDTAAATGGDVSCEKGHLGDITCRIPALAAGATVDIVAEATVGTDPIHDDWWAAAGTASAFDVDATNNEWQLEFRASAPPAPPAPPPAPAPPAPAPAPPAATGGGGGGGAVDGGLALVLVSGVLWVGASARVRRRVERAARNRRRI